ncbi:hypothetical protein RchiOBHm_Chr7g0239071 [Rosa chinensis]|uniref:Uncharacterized protein n=1 Tax=Rosa chinensis TaxID=74649 RepID=A0A2P6PHM5_ROSCH|nr:hypothetical protein RchiOBHm_Chr7g0239071 [Rosa chinensis]
MTDGSDMKKKYIRHNNFLSRITSILLIYQLHCFKTICLNLHSDQPPLRPSSNPILLAKSSVTTDESCC